MPKQHPPLLDASFLRQLERLTLVSRRLQRGLLQGERRSPKRGVSVEFADYRPYVPGDDFRQIDWNVYARLDRFFIKLFVEEEDVTVHLLLDTSRSMDWGEPNKMRVACQLAAALGYIALIGLDRVTVTAFGQEIATLPPRRGRTAALALFDFLEQIRPAGTLMLGNHLQAYAASARQSGPLLLISDFFDATWQEGVRALLARRFDITLVQVLAPDELAPPLRGDWRLRDVETGADVEVTIDDLLVEQYQRTLHGWIENLRRWARAREMTHILLPSDTPLERIIFDLLRRQGVVQ